jgi:hypothetical protein
MSFRIGERALLRKNIGSLEEFAGREVIVESGLIPAKVQGHAGYVVRATWDGSEHAVAPEILEKIPPTYDGWQASSWDKCPWQPAKLRSDHHA